jgi:hypothetical protein
MANRWHPGCLLTDGHTAYQLATQPAAQLHDLHNRAAGGDLFNALHRGHKGNLTWHKRSSNPADPLPAQPVQGLGKRIALDIARGLHFLHTHRIVSVALSLWPFNVPVSLQSDSDLMYSMRPVLFHTTRHPRAARVQQFLYDASMLVAATEHAVSTCVSLCRCTWM